MYDESLKVNRGTQSRMLGGLEYQLCYLLDALLMADSLKNPDALGSVTHRSSFRVLFLLLSSIMCRL